MLASRRFAIALLLLLVSSTIHAAQDESPVAIGAAAAGEKIRFIAQDGAQIRVQMISDGGNPLFDSSWKDGNVFDWSIDQSLLAGSHRWIVMVKRVDGEVIRKEISIEPQESSGKITLLAHDGANGSIVSSSGDLSFRFGDFLSGKDSERMRLTADGDLNVSGLIRANKGIVFPDGTILTTARGATPAPYNGIRPQPAGSFILRGLEDQTLKAGPNTSPLKPRANFTPAYQFVVGDTGVKVGTTNPNYNLDVTGSVNTATQYNIGGSAFAYTLNNNTFVGIGSGSTMSGGDNTAIGVYTLLGSNTGSSNTALGAKALESNTVASGNTAVGAYALQLNDVGAANTAIGLDALYSNTNGVNNVAIGYTTLMNNTGGSYNIAIGRDALINTNIGTRNLGIGYQTLWSTNGGTGNIAVGDSAGYYTSGNYNIMIGNGGLIAENGAIRIGTGGVQTRAYIAGINGVTTGGQAVPVVIDTTGQLGTMSSSRRYKFDINDMDHATDDLMQLRPVTFRYLAHGDHAPLEYGLIAEEVAEVYPELVMRNKDGAVETVMYQFLAPMLLNEVQKQRKTINDLERRLEALERRSK